ncbi:LPS export ABC transporter permease LptF [Moraxella nasovis]|nr:LPS export ABC transporter permease LptF [Moraxella nasovis]
MTTTLVLGFLVVMLLGGRFIRYFGMAAEGGLSVSVLFSLITYNLPYFLELIFPLSFFVALMLVFGRMYADHEMAVLNSSGISRGAIGRQLGALILVFIVLQAWITFIAKPWGVHRSDTIWHEQSVVQVFDLIKPKTFVSVGKYQLYVGEIGQDRQYLKDVIIIESSDNPNKPNKDAIIYAKSMTQTSHNSGAIQLDLHQGRRYEVNATTGQYNQIGFERYRISLAQAASEDISSQRVEGLTTWQLLSAMKNKSPNNASQIQAEFGYRASLPWLILIAVMLALPLSQTKPRQGRWLKLVPAVFVFVASVIVLISLKETISKGKMGVWIYPVAVVGFVLLGLYLNYHERIIMRLRLSKESAS